MSHSKENNSGVSDRINGALLVYHHPLLRNATTIMEHVDAFEKHSQFKIWNLNTELGFPPALQNMRFNKPVIGLVNKIDLASKKKSQRKLTGALFQSANNPAIRKLSKQLGAEQTVLQASAWDRTGFRTLLTTIKELKD